MPLALRQVYPTMQHAELPTHPNGSLVAGQYTLVFRIRHKTNKTLYKEHRLILMPQRFSETTEARTALYYTKSGLVGDTPAGSGIGVTLFQIQGHTGFRGVLADLPPPAPVRLPGILAPVASVVEPLVTAFRTGAAPALRSSFVDGAAAIKDFQDLIRAYFFPQVDAETREVTETKDLQLEFLNLTAPTSAEDRTGRVGWVIHPHRNLVDIQQDASKPFLYHYSFQFAGIRPLEEPDIPDVFEERLTAPRTGLQRTLAQMTAVVTSLTNGINTLEDAFTQMVNAQFTGPVSTFVLGCAQLGDAVANFMDSTAAKLRFPLYAQRTLVHALDAPAHSVTTLAQAAKDLGVFLYEASAAKTVSTLVAGESLAGGINDLLTLRLNRERSISLPLGTQPSGTAIASTIQAQVRAHTPEHAANASAYRDFTATFAQGQYTLTSGTALSDAASVEVVVTADPLLAPTDASAALGLGLANGGQEQAGSAYPNKALALLRGVEQACTHLQGFPDYFADQLDAQDAALAALLPAGVTRPQIRGDQYLRQTRITPGDTLQGIGHRVGVPWETLALVNRLTYPFILEEPTTLTQGRVSSADPWSIVDVTRTWAVDAYQGQRVDIVAGVGAGQSRRILRNTLTTLVLETAWTVTPSDISDYAIRAATNPVQHAGAVSSATTRTVTDSSLSLVPGSQRGLTLVVTSGGAVGDRRPIADNDATTYTLVRPWEVVPEPGALYLLLGPAPATFRQKVVGDWLGVPQPSAQARLPIRTRLHDVSAITGQQRSVEERLFGRDLLLDLDTRALVWDAALGDARTIAELPNLRQALIHYINLPLAELEYAPGLGSYVQEALGLSATLPLQIELLSSVERTIRQDRRIARMINAQLVGSGGTVLIAFGAQAINGSTIDRIAIR